MREVYDSEVRQAVHLAEIVCLHLEAAELLPHELLVSERQLERKAYLALALRDLEVLRQQLEPLVKEDE